MDVNSLLKRKDVVVSVIVLAVALIVAKSLYQSQLKQKTLLQQQRDAELKKNELFKQMSGIKRRVESYEQALVKNPDAVMNHISDVARDSNVKIASLKPVLGQGGEFYVPNTFSLNVEADNYHTLGMFVSKLERNPELYIIEEIEIVQLVENEAKGGILKAAIQVSAISAKQ